MYLLLLFYYLSAVYGHLTLSKQPDSVTVAPSVRTEILTVILSDTGTSGYGLVLRPAMTDPDTALPEIAAVVPGSAADRCVSALILTLLGPPCNPAGRHRVKLFVLLISFSS